MELTGFVIDVTKALLTVHKGGPPAVYKAKAFLMQQPEVTDFEYNPQKFQPNDMGGGFVPPGGFSDEEKIPPHMREKARKLAAKKAAERAAEAAKREAAKREAAKKQAQK